MIAVETERGPGYEVDLEGITESTDPLGIGIERTVAVVDEERALRAYREYDKDVHEVLAEADAVIASVEETRPSLMEVIKKGLTTTISYITGRLKSPEYQSMDNITTTLYKAYDAAVREMEKGNMYTAWDGVKVAKLMADASDVNIPKEKASKLVSKAYAAVTQQMKKGNTATARTGVKVAEEMADYLEVRETDSKQLELFPEETK